MAEIYIPWEHTIVLPEGSPAISSINDIQAEMRLNQCGIVAGELYCLGEADILIHYQSAPPPSSGGLFGRNSEREAGSSWQAMMTLPVELYGEGVLPPKPVLLIDSLDWYMVSDRAVELEAMLAIVDGETAGPMAGAALETPQENQESGEWIMVTLDEMSKMLADEQNSAESVNQLAAQANETVAKCRELWNKYEAAHLAEETEEGPEPEFMDYGEEGPEPEFMDYEEEGPEPESMDYEEEGPEPEFMDYEEEGPEPEFMDYGEEGPEPMMAQMAEETEEALPPATPLAFDLGGPEEEGELALMDFNHMEPDMEPGMEPEPGLEPEPEAELEPAPIKGRFALRMIFGKDEEQAAPAVTETAAEAGPEIMPGIVAEAGPEIETLALEATAGEAPPLPEPVAAEVKPAKARRRSWGLPTLHVDAKDNNIEISAFNLNIKL